MPTDLAFGVVLVRFENKRPLVLVVQKKWDAIKEEAGHWGLPKGHANPGESPEDTARRELMEETGIADCEIDTKHQWSVTYTVNKQNMIMEKTVVYFIGFTIQSSVFADPKEVADCAWLPFEQAILKVTYDSVKDILRKAEPLAFQRASSNI